MMQNSAAQAPAAHLAVIDDIKRDGGAITYNADGEQRVTFPAQLGALRAMRILHELYG